VGGRRLQLYYNDGRNYLESSYKVKNVVNYILTTYFITAVICKLLNDKGLIN